MKILVVGDVMLDRYTYVCTQRFAPENPGMPVWDEVRTETRLGGAANVANNVRAMAPDAQVFIAGILGTRETRYAVEAGLVTDFLVAGESMVKHRYVDDWSGRYVMRVDNVRTFDPEIVGFFRSFFDGWMFTDLHKFDAVVVSDYDKGLLSREMFEVLQRHPLTIVDSKRRDLRTFEGAKLLKLNESEYSAQVSSDLYPCFERLFDHCVITRGGKSTLHRQCVQTKSNDKRYMVRTEEFPVERVPTVDVTGCGDTHTAAMAVSLVRDGDVRKAIRFANEQAASVVQRFGTCTV